MGNVFQDQLLKAGIVTKQQVKKAQSASNKKKKEQRSKRIRLLMKTNLKPSNSLKKKQSTTKL